MRECIFFIFNQPLKFAEQVSAWKVNHFRFINLQNWLEVQTCCSDTPFRVTDNIIKLLVSPEIVPCSLHGKCRDSEFSSFAFIRNRTEHGDFISQNLRKIEYCIL